MLVSAIHHHESVTGILCPLPLELPSHPQPHPTLYVVTKQWIELSVSHSKFPLSVSFTYGNVYVSMLLSQFFPPSPSHTVSTSLFSMSVSQLLPCKLVHQYHLSRFHTHVLICNICLSLSPTSLCTISSKFIHLIRTNSNVFLFMAEQGKFTFKITIARYILLPFCSLFWGCVCSYFFPSFFSCLLPLSFDDC